MSKITGVIAEFNPFHNGHAFLLSKITGPSVVVMSGNWMQRGEPAFIDKWTRTQMALQNGADLVVELPLLAAVQGADFFAQRAMDILSGLGVDQLLFGSESDTDYQAISEVYKEKREEMAAYMKNLPSAMSYPHKAQLAWEKFAAIKFDGNTPNHILGLAYAKAADKIQLSTIKRVGSGYNSNTLKEGHASATAIRQAILTGNFPAIQAHVPENCWELLGGAARTSWADFWPFLRYKVSVMPDLTMIYQVNQELGNRIKEQINYAQNLSDLIERVYTKRYTKGHIRRLLTYILLDIQTETLPEKIHVLGFNKTGQKILSGARGKTITRIGQNPWDENTQKADRIYQLGNSKIREQIYGQKPRII